MNRFKSLSKRLLASGPRSDDGVTLVELMIAAALFSMAATVLLQSVVSVAQLNQQGRERAVSSSHLGSIFEFMRGMDYEEMLETDFDPEGGAPFFTFDRLKSPTVKISAYMPVGDSENTETEQLALTQLPVNVDNYSELPDPVEIVVELHYLDDAGRETKTTASSMISSSST